MTDIDAIASFSYAEGQDPLDYAIEQLAMFLEVANDVSKVRADTPAAFPGIENPATEQYWARRMMSTLIDAGWRPPSPGQVKAAAQGAKAHTAWFNRHRDKPCSCGHTCSAHTGWAGQCLDCQGFGEPECFGWKPHTPDDPEPGRQPTTRPSRTRGHDEKGDAA